MALPSLLRLEAPRLALFLFAGTVAGLSYRALKEELPGSYLSAATIGFGIGLGLHLARVALERTRPGRWLQRRPFYVSTLVEFVVYTGVVTLVLDLGGRLQAGISYVDRQSVLYSLDVSWRLVLLWKIVRLIGGSVLFNLAIGRYNQPVRDERAFLFLDLVGSTAIAERLGETETQALVSQFFFDIAEPIALWGGQIYQYRGDEISVSWPMARAAKRAAPIRCAQAIHATIAKRSAYYQSRFGLMPQFRIGLHGGPVVAGEVGDAKREIVFFGDTLNTTARLIQAAKQHGVGTCISASLLGTMSLPDRVAAASLGPVLLRGKADPIEVYALAFD